MLRTMRNEMTSDPTVGAAQQLVEGASRIVGFTGAGISTESDVPDFRSPGGVWSHNRIVDFQEFVSNEAGRTEYWRQKVASWPAMRDAQPNAGHYGFVELHRQGRLEALITQNIERLHQRSGLPIEKVLELHGTTTEAACLTCADRISMEEACQRIEEGDGVPLCRECGGFLKPATISFGQAMPRDVMTRAVIAAEACDLMLAVGSSLVVEPAASIPRVARQAGAHLIIVNRDPTPLDRIADAVVLGEIGVVLPQLVRRDG